MSSAAVSPGIAGGKACAIPAHGGVIETAADVHVQRFGIVTDVFDASRMKRISSSPVQVSSTATADVGLCGFRRCTPALLPRASGT